MLLNDFYKIFDVEVGEANLKGNIQFNPEHNIFEGHFPQQPVVPGVCMMQIIKELLETHFKQSLILKNAGQVKFLQLIKPDVRPEVVINWRNEEQGYWVNAVFKLERDLFKLTGSYQINHA